MARKEDLTGNKYGRWTVIKRGERRKHWLCQCECGTEREVDTTALKTGKSLSCGCYQRELVRGTADDLTGKKFEMLTVIERAGDEYKRGYWKCRCDCGNEKIVNGHHLRHGRIKSCGCYARKVSAVTNSKHGMSTTRMYHIWLGMKRRCNAETCTAYERYGGRGITVCNEWENDFEAFHKWSIENGYSDDLTIDRIDNNKGYAPDNCRWVDYKKQANNKRTNHNVTINGITHTLAEWEKETGIGASLIAWRIRKGWDESRLLIPANANA